MDDTVLVLAFLSRSSEIIGKKMHVKFDNNELLINLNVNIYSDSINKNFPKMASNLEVNFLENKDHFTEDDCKNLYKLYSDTFVEESERLKEYCAAACLTNND